MKNTADKRKIIDIGDVAPSRKDFFVIGVFNPGVAQYKDEVILLLRVAEKAKSSGCLNVPIFNGETNAVEVKSFDLNDPDYNFKDPRVIYGKHRNYITSMSHLRLARSRDGIHFTVDDKPAICCQNKLQGYGVEDARITRIGDVYYIAYSSASEYGIVESLSVTKDFKTYEHKGAIFAPDNKDAAIFPDKINGKYYALHRPSSSEYGKPEMWIAESDNLTCWGNHRHFMSVRDGMFDSGRIGAGCVPFLTDEGWLELYHGATKENRYCLGAVLTDKNDPAKILARSRVPFMEPTEEFERNGFFGNVVFSCGCIARGNDVDVYYGAADKAVGLARIALRDILADMS
ncbi:glycosidase [Clostridia bacterium]|nr:glycosidase [Clostridia bacterium]